MIVGNTCFQCNQVITKDQGYPKDDDEYKFCSKGCYDKYLKDNNRVPSLIKVVR